MGPTFDVPVFTSFVGRGPRGKYLVPVANRRVTYDAYSI